MATRSDAVRIVEALHAARVGGDLAAMCRLFARTGEFRIAGASADKPIAIAATTLEEFRPWLAMLVKVFKVNRYELLSLIIEDQRVAAHWRAEVLSKITGVTGATELIDLVEIVEQKIVVYREFFVPR